MVTANCATSKVEIRQYGLEQLHWPSQWEGRIHQHSSVGSANNVTDTRRQSLNFSTKDAAGKLEEYGAEKVSGPETLL